MLKDSSSSCSRTIRVTYAKIVSTTLEQLVTVTQWWLRSTQAFERPSETSDATAAPRAALVATIKAPRPTSLKGGGTECHEVRR